MLKSIQPQCLMCPPTFHRTLMGCKEGLHVLAHGSMESLVISAIGCPPRGFKSFKQSNQKKKKKGGSTVVVQASLMQKPLMWAGRLCLMYAMLKVGTAGSQANFQSDGEGLKWMPKWLKNLLPVDSETQAANERRKMVSKWHVTTKGTLKRSYRVPTKSEGRRLLKAIASILSDDDTFLDASCHKGCQIRRENAHGESVCCKNVRALFDELPTPHLVVEITAFPAGPLSETDYFKAEKIEKVLRTAATI